MIGKKKTSKSLLAGKFVLIIVLAGKEQVISGNLEVLLKGGNSHFFTANSEIQLLIFPGDFELDIINNFAAF